MRFRKLGNSDLQVSEISLGSWLTYSGGVAAEQTRACTEAAFDAGINFFDTANAYGQGAAETAWGEILSEHPRDSYILATKVFGAMSDTDQGLSGEQIAKQIDASLTNPAAHRPRRPVPGPSLRPDGADRGDHRGVPEGRGAGQGPGRSRLVRRSLATFVADRPASIICRIPRARCASVRSCFWSLVTIWCTIRSMVSSLASAALDGKTNTGTMARPTSRAASVRRWPLRTRITSLLSGCRTPVIGTRTPFSAMLARKSLLSAASSRTLSTSSSMIGSKYSSVPIA